MHKTKINTASTLIFVLGIAVVLSTAGIGLTQQQLAFATTQGNQPDRVTICHIPPDDPDNPQTMTLPERAAERHIAHGDSVGPCEEEPPEPDTTPPTLTVPPDRTVEATSPDGEVVTFSVTAEDNVDGIATLEEDNTLTQDNVGGSIIISCNPPSGSTFPLGSTDVNCTATDAAGNTAETASFTVTVQIICFNAPATIVGTNGDDNLPGTAGDDVIAGLGGDDTIEGLGLNDLICGNEGIDTVRGGDGNDILFGGDGSDDMSGGAGEDFLGGDAGDDTMSGGDDFDIMRGGDGSDHIEGGADRDDMFGDAGDDILDGVDGVVNNDNLNGGPDTDTCTSDPDFESNCEP